MRIKIRLLVLMSVILFSFMFMQTKTMASVYTEQKLSLDTEAAPEKEKLVEPDPVLNGLAQDEDGYVLYAEGVKVTEKGWKELSGGKFYVNGNGYVTEKMEETDGAWYLYQYNSQTLQWDRQKDTWKSILKKAYYFNKSGICIRMYDTAAAKLYVGKKLLPASNKVYTLKNGRMYYFNSQGLCEMARGWKKVNKEQFYYVNGKGHVSAKLRKTQKIWKYYQYNYNTLQWEIQKDIWKQIEGKYYYFNANGRCTTIYNSSTRKCQKYSDGRMQAVKKDIRRLKNGKLYYFNGKGKRVTKKGWQKSSGKQYIRVGKSKYVTAKMQNSKGTWRYYKYNYHKNKWEKQKKVWITLEKKKFYFNGSGICVRIYNTATKKCYDCSKGRKQLVKNDAREINKKKYYFGADGVKVNRAGMYLTCHGTLIYAGANGIVVKRISGQILSYSMTDGLVASCKVKDGVYMCYYNGNAEPRRKIDTSRPMVALTYDDGPSQYTPEILSVLRQYNSVATFFVVGNRVSSYSDTVRSAYQMGCEIGNHTYSHQVLTKVGVSTIQSQIGATNSAVQNVTGVSPVVMRPPGGGQNDTVRSAVSMPLIMWSIDTLDWKTKNAASTQNAVLGKVRDGDIVLMHDLYSQTAAASRIIIPELVRRGYQLVTVSELSDCRGAMAKGCVYSAFR